MWLSLYVPHNLLQKKKSMHNVRLHNDDLDRLGIVIGSVNTHQNGVVKYNKRLLLRCIQHFKYDLTNNMDHMSISGNEPSSVV